MITSPSGDGRSVLRLLLNRAVRRASIGSLLVAMCGAGVGCSKRSPAEPGSAASVASPTAPAPAAATSPAAAATPPASAPAAPEAVRRLLGRWTRADGGYVLDLRRAELSGVLDAAYFNPKPIHVSRAVWMQGGPGLQVAIELNDVGYPGATYLLTYDAQNDRLAGQYTQPAMQQSFDIEFAREPRQ